MNNYINMYTKRLVLKVKLKVESNSTKKLAYETSNSAMRDAHRVNLQQTDNQCLPQDDSKNAH